MFKKLASLRAQFAEPEKKQATAEIFQKETLSDRLHQMTKQSNDIKKASSGQDVKS